MCLVELWINQSWQDSYQKLRWLPLYQQSDAFLTIEMQEEGLLFTRADAFHWSIWDVVTLPGGLAWTRYICGSFRTRNNFHIKRLTRKWEHGQDIERFVQYAKGTFDMLRLQKQLSHNWRRTIQNNPRILYMITLFSAKTFP